METKQHPAARGREVAEGQIRKEEVAGEEERAKTDPGPVRGENACARIVVTSGLIRRENPAME